MKWRNGRYVLLFSFRSTRELGEACARIFPLQGEAFCGFVMEDFSPYSWRRYIAGSRHFQAFDYLPPHRVLADVGAGIQFQWAGVEVEYVHAPVDEVGPTGPHFVAARGGFPAFWVG